MLPLVLLLALAPGAALAHPSTAQVAPTLQELLTEAPHNPRPYLMRAEQARRSGHWQQALADLSRAERLGAEADTVGLQRAELLLATEQHQLALETLSPLLLQYPEHLRLRWLRGQALLRLGQVEPGLAELAAVYQATSRRTPELLLELVQEQARAGHLRPAMATVMQGLEHLGSLSSLQRAAMSLELCLHLDAAAERRAAKLPRPRGELLMAEALALAGRSSEAERRFLALSRKLSASAESTAEPTKRRRQPWQRRVELGLQQLHGEASVAAQMCR